MSKLYQAIYVSSAHKLFNEEELNSLLEYIRPLNAKNGITGLLAYKDGNIMQVLEGEQQKVMELIAKIKLDTRHSGVIELLTGLIEKRQFADWSMAYSDLSAESSAGFSDFLSPDKSEHEETISAGNAKILMLNFRKNM